MADFDELVTEAMDAPFSGWDFSWLDGRSRSEPLPWDYSVRVAALACTARTLGVTAMSRNPYGMAILLRAWEGGLTTGK